MPPLLSIVTARVRFLHWFFAALLGLLSAGCGDPRSIVEPIVYAGRGGWSPNTEFEFERASWDSSIQQEVAGKPPGGGQTWNAFWHARYLAIRQHGEPALIKRKIAYIHQQRQHYGLPLYDD